MLVETTGRTVTGIDSPGGQCGFGRGRLQIEIETKQRMLSGSWA
jgi:hypothetical protein